VNAHEGSSAGTRRQALRERDDAVIARLSSLATALDGEPDPAFRAAARTRLVAMAAVRTPDAPARAPRSTARARWRRRLTAGLAAGVVVAAALATLVAFAAGSGPGDPLYGIKKGTEQTQLVLAGNSRRGPVLLDLARTRLAELRALAGTPAPKPALLLQTLHTMDSQTAEASAWFDARAIDRHSAAPLDQLTHWTSGQSSALAALRGHLPAAVSAAVEHSMGVLTATESRAQAVRATLATAGRPPATATTGGRAPVGSSSPGAPTPVVGVPGVGSAGSGPGRSGGTTAAHPSGAVPSLPSPGGSSGIGGLPKVPVPGAGGPGAGQPLPTLPVPTGTAICVGPISVGHC
jgi:hypothetical protein